MPKPRKVPVTARALAQRIKRRLRGTSHVLLGRRGRPTAKPGHFILIDAKRNVVVDPAVDLAALGRKVGALKGFEELVDLPTVD